MNFGSLLRSWRTQRRFSQAVLASAAETPSRHISFLETGRARPSREMVERLSTALEIPLRERNQMMRAAGFADAYADRRLDGEGMVMLRAAVLKMMTAHDPYPSLVIDRHWTVVDANKSARKMLSLVGPAFRLDQPEHPVNLFDLMFSTDGLRPYVENWEDYARQTIQRLHREALSPADLRAGLNRIRRYPDLPSDWWARDVTYEVAPVFALRLALPNQKLSFFSVVATVAVPTDVIAQELRVETLFPADAETEACMRAARR